MIDLYKKSEICKKFSICKETFDRYIAPVVPYVQIGKQKRYRVTDLLKFIENNHKRQDIIAFESWKRKRIHSMLDDIILKHKAREVS